MLLSSEEIKNQIDQAWAGVEQSKTGKILENVAPTPQFPDGIKVNTIPMQTFLTVVSALFKQ